MHSKRRISQTSAQRAAAMLEAAFGVVVFLLLLAAIIEFGRFLAVRSTLLRGAQEALKLAETIPFLDYDPPRLATDNAQWAQFSDARNRVLAVGVSTIGHFIDNVSSPSGTRLLPYSFNAGAGGHPLAARYGATQWPFAVVLPGERYVGDQVVAVHPTFPPFTPYASMKSVMYTHPLMVEMRARYDAILPIPWLVPSSITVRVLGFRELPSDRNMQPGPIQLTTVTSVASTTSTSVAATTSSAPTTVVTTTTSFGSSTTTTTTSAGSTSVATTTTSTTLDCPACPRGAYRISSDNCTCACRPGWRPNGRGGCSRGSE